MGHSSLSCSLAQLRKSLKQNIQAKGAAVSVNNLLFQPLIRRLGTRGHPYPTFITLVVRLYQTCTHMHAHIKYIHARTLASSPGSPIFGNEKSFGLIRSSMTTISNTVLHGYALATAYPVYMLKDKATVYATLNKQSVPHHCLFLYL